MAFFDDLYDDDHEDKIMADDPDSKPEETLPKAPWSMLGPMLVSAVSLLLIGIFNKPIIEWINEVVKTAASGGGAAP